jgi:UDP-glucose:(heptosyl)LPS alpha-1,3-glucosyltransferase
MSKETLTIGFARRGYSASGGAEAYLKRLAEGVVEAGHEAQLFTTEDWPTQEWPFGELVRIEAKAPIGFATELERVRTTVSCDALVSLERVLRCDVYRAGDGVHQAWLDRRRRFEPLWRTVGRTFRRKHRDILRLEKSLLDDRGAERVIVNSRMVKREIIDLYNYRRDRIEVIPNGIPLRQFGFDPVKREKSRGDLGVEAGQVVVLFAGTGWERKGLRYAIKAIEDCSNGKVCLFVAGRGEPERYRSERARFLGELADVRPIYAAADIFILPSIYDPFSNACLEAMASGLPVITTTANGFSEIMEDRIHGSIVDQPDDISDLCAAVEAWSDSTRRSAARASILKRASQFDISRNVERTLAVIVEAGAPA